MSSLNPIQRATLNFILNHKWVSAFLLLMAGILFFIYRGEFSFGSATLETAILVVALGATVSAAGIAVIPSRLSREAFPELRNKPSFAPVGVNEPCPCGSGKKFKKCCLKNC